MIFITGATRGIGLAIARALSSQRLILHGSSLQSLAALREEFPEALCVAADFSNKVAIQAMLAEIQQQTTELSAIIHCAGNTRDARAVAMPLEDFEHVFHVHATSFFMIATTLKPLLKPMSDVLVMTSTAGLFGSKGQLNYSAAKGALTMMSYTLAEEWRREHIRVNAISPAALTDMTRPVIDYLTQKSAREQTPFPDYWRVGSVEDVARFVAALISRDDFFTGHVFGVNGTKTTRYRGELVEWSPC